MMITDETTGDEIEVFTADEVKVRETSAAAAAKLATEAEFTPKLTEAQQKIEEARVAANTRAGEFAQVRKLSDDQVAKLTEAERTIYENTQALQKANEERLATEKKMVDATRDAAIAAVAGVDTPLAKKVIEFWDIVGVEATTPEQIRNKLTLVLGALSTQEPDLVASANNFSGSFQPPKPTVKEGESFADTERGKQAAKELGFMIEAK